MHSIILLIRMGTALTMVLFGLNQFFSPQKWIDYIPGWMRKLSPMQPQTTMRIHSLGNIFLGIWLALGFAPVLGAWINIIWWASILPFAFMKDWRIGLRDLSITFSLIALLLVYKLT